MAGFSRGAYQVRVIAGMIEKVETSPVVFYHSADASLTFRSDFYTRETIIKFHCTLILHEAGLEH